MEIQVLACDRLKKVAGLNRLILTQVHNIHLLLIGFLTTIQV